MLKVHNAQKTGRVIQSPAPFISPFFSLSALSFQPTAFSLQVCAFIFSLPAFSLQLSAMSFQPLTFRLALLSFCFLL
jgi:hypothetical protein